MLEIAGLSVAAGQFCLHDIDLQVGAGACHAVLGPSGAGKTTLLNAVLGLLPPRRGSIRLAGRDVTRVPIEQRGLGYVPQQLGLFPHLSVRDNVLYSARARGVPAAQIAPLLDNLVSATGLGALLERKPATLSGGERQRVCVARALASQPRALLLDEPFTALNESLRRELWWLVRALQRELQIAVLLVTHDLTEAYVLADHVTVLVGGRVVQQGTKADVYSRPATPEMARFFGVETLHAGQVIEVHGDVAMVRVGRSRVAALATAGLPRDVLVSIRGEDVMLVRDGVRHASARNALPAQVVTVRPGAPLWTVELDAGFPLVALLTRPACEELELRPGVTVTACIKATSVHLIGAGSACCSGNG